MNLQELIYKTRSYRRFDESHFIDINILKELVDLARMSASGANRQPLKYLIYNDEKECDRIFPSLAWAGYLEEWHGPQKGERPSGYIIILGDKNVTETFGVDHGIAAQSIMLGATDKGLGGCIIASLRRDDLQNELEIPDNFEILLVLAIGKSVEKIIIDDVKDGDIKYWRDSDLNHHVPKRKLDDLIVNH